MSERFWRWATPMFHVAGVLAWTYIAMSILMLVFPPSETSVLAISAFVVFWLFVGGVTYLIVHLALPDGWAPPGCWRFVLFGFGLVLLDGDKLGAERMKFLRDAQYTLWPVRERWILSPALPGWVTRLWRRWRKS